ncbi:Hypothetical_protein [Hexamita inflata]|uniref:Hypothetical_protein n=1 Tax=Hexamita inflata TaxID=28002 RepID=A0AA86PCS1_9EUKA|nr:Hypothetical protein HINF_LOCUS21142 [Hexamita inflata]
MKVGQQITIQKKNVAGSDTTFSGSYGAQQSIQSVIRDLFVRLSKITKVLQGELGRIRNERSFTRNFIVSRNFGDFNYKPAMSFFPVRALLLKQNNDLVWDLRSQNTKAENIKQRGCPSWRNMLLILA